MTKIAIQCSILYPLMSWWYMVPNLQKPSLMAHFTSFRHNWLIFSFLSVGLSCAVINGECILWPFQPLKSKFVAENCVPLRTVFSMNESEVYAKVPSLMHKLYIWQAMYCTWEINVKHKTPKIYHFLSHKLYWVDWLYILLVGCTYDEYKSMAIYVSGNL